MNRALKGELEINGAKTQLLVPTALKTGLEN
jgi:hypothetical protein